MALSNLHIAHRLHKLFCLFGLLIFIEQVAAPAGYAQLLNDATLRVRNLFQLPLGGAGGTDVYTGMAFIGANDILFLGKDNGKVTRVTNGVSSVTVLDLNVTANGLSDERGLLGIALHPNFASNGFVYLYYTKSNTAGDNTGTPLDNRVERYTWNGTSLVNPLLIQSMPSTSPDHNGGTITFGTDGKLYFVIGDQDRTGQLQNNSAGAGPDNTGVIFRLNDDGTTPTDNPFFALGGNLARYYAYGIRNSFGLASDPLSGKLWMTENGFNDYDEINLVVPGFNSGWNKITGPDSRDPQGVADLKVFAGSQYADPKFSWLQVVAPTALAFVSSNQLGTAYFGNLFVGDFNTGRLYRFKLNGARDGFVFQDVGLADLVADNSTELGETVLGQQFAAISDLKMGPDGKLYVLSVFGTIYVVERNLEVNCSTGSLQTIIDAAFPGDVITVFGTCTENILIRNEKQRLTITRSTLGSGTILAADPTRPAVIVRGKGILLQNLTIGGSNIGVYVNRGSNAVLDGNSITGSDYGVIVDELGFAVMTNNAINGDLVAGILVSENSTARIGFNSDADTVESPNQIDSPGVGVMVSHGSSARIVGNLINSGSNGIVVERDSHADIASNTISGGIDGVVVTENASVQLGEDSGSNIFEAENVGGGNEFGIRCLSGGVVNGTLGTLDGILGAKTFAPSCIDSLL